MTVDLVYFPGCPNVTDAREAIARAFALVGREARWREWNSSDRDTPRELIGFGSPAILVDGADIGGQCRSEGAEACRVYRDDSGAFRGVPPSDLVAEALRRGMSDDRAAPRAPSSWTNALAGVPAIGVAALPKLACPACWPAYSGVLSALGLGALIDSTYLLALTLVFLTLSLAALGFRARRRRGYGPLALGAIGAALILFGKFALDSDIASYGGVAALIGASVWNLWPPRSRSAACTTCGETSTQHA